MRSESFPFPSRFAAGISELGTLSYFDTGEVPRTAMPPAPPVVLLHALGTNYTHWEYVVPALARHTRVIGLDMPGCGHSSRPRKPYRLADVCASIGALLEHLGLGRPDSERLVLVGHSFGGRVAMELTLQKPQRVRGLVLLNSAGFVRYPEVFLTVGRHLLSPPVVGTLLLGLAPIFLGRIFAEQSPRSERFMDQVLDRIDTRFAYDFAHHACPLLPDLVSDVIDRLPELKVPVQILWGDRDALLDYEKVLPALRSIPNVDIVKLSGCGHMPNLERPELVCTTILGFLEKLRKAAPQG
jgi:pimeloyl-ACP methyl ester carboxylesterase